jgi:CheY-like chemotaxis protein
MTNKIILLVEDNPSDRQLTQRAFDRAQISCDLIALPDGLAALDYLFGQGRYADRDPRQLPALVLLDLKMPGLNGLEVLRRIRSDDRTRRVPVVMLTSSDEEHDIRASYDLGVNSYIRKPVDFHEFAGMVKELGRYWLDINETPPTG